MKRIIPAAMLFLAASWMQSAQAMSMEEWAAWLRFQQMVEPYGGLSGYEAYLDAQEFAASAGSSTGTGIGVGTGVAVGGSIVGIALGGAGIYYDIQLIQQQQNLLQQMQNPPPQPPGAPYYNPSVPLDLFDPFANLSNYWYYFTHPFAG